MSEDQFMHYALEFLQEHDRENSEIFPQIAAQNEGLYSRSNPIGHVTASAFILNPDMTSALLIKHKKLGLWLPPGGHVDPGEEPIDAARREACEETGITDLTSLSDFPLDFDIHPFPVRNNEPGHWHADACFPFLAKSMDVDLNLHECDAFAWITLDDLHQSPLESIRRLSKRAKKLFW